MSPRRWADRFPRGARTGMPVAPCDNRGTTAGAPVRWRSEGRGAITLLQRLLRDRRRPARLAVSAMRTRLAGHLRTEHGRLIFGVRLSMRRRCPTWALDGLLLRH